MFSSLSLLVLVALLLSACGAIPANNYAGLATDGDNLYVANQNFVYAVNPVSGTVEWKYPAKPDQNMTFFGAPALADGWMYAGDYKNVAFGFALEGIDPGNPTPTWTFNQYEGKGRFMGAPAVAGDLVLFPSTDRHLYVLDRKAGTLRWRLETRGALWAPAASDGDLAYQPGLDHYLYAFDLARGSLRWEIDLGGPIIGGLTFGLDGQLYLGTLNQELVAVNAATGKVLWRHTVEGNVWSAPLLHDGKLYFGTDKNKVYIFTAADGQELKVMDAAGSVIASPVYTDGAVVVSSEDGAIFTMTLDGENRRSWPPPPKGKLYSNPVVVNNQVVFAPYQQSAHILVGYDFEGKLDEKWNTVAPK